MPSDSSTVPVEALLAEQGWMRSLAVALLRDAEVADDVVQDAILAALHRPPTADRPLRPWLRSVVRNLAWRRIERDSQRVHREREVASERPEADLPSAAELNARLELRALVVQLVRDLDEPYRSTLLLRYFEDRTPAEIASHTQVPAGTVRWRLKVGLDRLRDRMDERHGGDRLAWARALVPVISPDRPLAQLGTAALLTNAFRAMNPALKLALVSVPVLVAGLALLPEDAPLGEPSERAAVGALAVPDAGQESPDVAPEGPAPTAQDRQVLAAPAPEPSELLSAALLAYAEAEIAAGWREGHGSDIPEPIAAELLDEFEALVLSQPRALGRGRGEEQTEIELASVEGEVFGILTALDSGTLGVQTELVDDAEAFEALFEPRSKGPGVNVHGNLARPDELLSDGATLVLTAGVYRLDRLMDDLDPFPRDVTIAGAGMDVTLLVAGDLSTRHTLANFALRDLTVHTDNNYLFDIRREPASVRFDRVRAIGFDMGAGASCLFGTEELAFYARDSIIAGGYGRHPEHGQLFDVRTNGLLARFERCEIDAVEIGSPSSYRNTTIVFEDCRLTNIMGGFPTPAALRDGVVLRGTTVSYFDRYDDEANQWVEPPSKDLNELFPDWRQRIER